MPRPIEYSSSFEEIAPDHRLTATDVDVEHLQVVELVEHGFGFGGGQLARVAATRRRQAVHALEVAGVGEFPGEADRGVEARSSAAQPAGTGWRSWSISESLRDVNARSNDGQRRSSMPQARKRVGNGVVVVEGPDDAYDVGMLEEDQLAVCVVVRERPEGLGPQGDVRVQRESATEHVSRRRTSRRSRSPRREVRRGGTRRRGLRRDRRGGFVEPVDGGRVGSGVRSGIGDWSGCSHPAILVHRAGITAA